MRGTTAVVCVFCLCACGGDSFTTADIATGAGGAPSGSGGYFSGGGGGANTGGKPGGGGAAGGIRPDASSLGGSSGGTGGGAGVVVTDSGPVTDAGPVFCHDNGMCLPTELCVKTTCAATTGFCKPRPVECGNEMKPVCGCDNITYFNDCLRLLQGVSASTVGECGVTSATCGGIAQIKCPNDVARCGYLFAVSAACNPDAMGICWVIPDQCPPGFGGTFRKCGNPTGPCFDTCNAVRAGGMYYVSDTSCPM